MKVDPTSPAPRVSAVIRLAAPSSATLQVVHGKKVTCLAIAMPRGRHYKTMIGYDLTAIGRDQLVTALLDWRWVQDELPPEGTYVLIACGGVAYQPGFGFHKDGRWYFDAGEPVDGGVPVYAWAHAPAMPAKKGGAS